MEKIVSQSVLDDAIDNPRRLVSLTKKQLYSIPSDIADEFRLSAAQARFGQLKDKVSMLKKLSEELEISHIDSIEGLAPLLFSNVVYKAYPIGWLEKCEFNRMTKWLNSLTSHDLSGVDASGCELIEDWLELLKRETPLYVNYSAALGGKMSFNPRTKEDWQFYTQMFLNVFQPFSTERSWEPLIKGKSRVPLFHGGPKKSGRPLSRKLEVYEQWFGKGLVVTPYEELDADILSVSGRLQEASKKGERGLQTINPRVLEMKERILKLKKEIPRLEEKMISDMVEKYQGQRVIMFGPKNQLFKLVERFEEKGIKSAYAPGSVFLYGGGL